ncbi:MAG: sulfotransferase [Hymenobacteraceae bacterium]|nr:sulfotransferase [Hymenobacteraceae bacterium]MDX5396835.1 sulfotransferase [Hymenobacteraceae bacterium]MDX5442181.1 sulfotransferase [Hymenobacteraceae bacterium]MDX5512906.1 sulfotransferase [Hymenobacteraceae bacterium]
MLSYLRTISVIYLKRLANALPLWQQKQYTKFVLLGRGRSGTTLLHTYLNSHPNVLSLGELMHPRHQHPLRHQNPIRYLQQYGFKNYSPLIKAVGFKMFYEWESGNVQHPLWQTLHQIPDLKVIHLRRENKLRNLVSYKIARQSRQWSQEPGQKQVAAQAKAVTLTKEECIAVFEKMTAEEVFFDRFFKNHSKINLTFEELTAQPNQVLQQVQEFIGVKPMQLVSLLQRQNPEPLQQLIINYDELKEQFRDSEWFRYFD